MIASIKIPDLNDLNLKIPNLNNLKPEACADFIEYMDKLAFEYEKNGALSPLSMHVFHIRLRGLGAMDGADPKMKVPYLNSETSVCQKISDLTERHAGLVELELEIFKTFRSKFSSEDDLRLIEKMKVLEQKREEELLEKALTDFYENCAENFDADVEIDCLEAIAASDLQRENDDIDALIDDIAANHSWKNEKKALKRALKTERKTLKRLYKATDPHGEELALIHEFEPDHPRIREFKLYKAEHAIFELFMQENGEIVLQDQAEFDLDTAKQLELLAKEEMKLVAAPVPERSRQESKQLNLFVVAVRSEPPVFQQTSSTGFSQSISTAADEQDDDEPKNDNSAMYWNTNKVAAEKRRQRFNF